MGKTVIKFYRQDQLYGQFSNFYASPILLKGLIWPTSEHYFQAMKFEGTNISDTIRNAETPSLAAQLGRSRDYPIRADWEEVKIEVMREVVYAKFTQHLDLQQLLIDTNDAKLIEHTSHDAFWGDGGHGNGQNWLGRILMEVRASLLQQRNL